MVLFSHGAAISPIGYGPVWLSISKRECNSTIEALESSSVENCSRNFHENFKFEQ